MLNAVVSVLLALLFVMIYPVIWMVLSSFRPELEIFGDVSGKKNVSGVATIHYSLGYVNPHASNI